MLLTSLGFLLVGFAQTLNDPPASEPTQRGNIVLPFLRRNGHMISQEAAPSWFRFSGSTQMLSSLPLGGVWGELPENSFSSVAEYWFLGVCGKKSLLLVQANSCCYLKSNHYDRKHTAFIFSVRTVRIFHAKMCLFHLEKKVIGNLAYLKKMFSQKWEHIIFLFELSVPLLPNRNNT